MEMAIHLMELEGFLLMLDFLFLKVDKWPVNCILMIVKIGH